ncbi:hypothetical protein LSH36_287g03033 [Paralvinella palmiformis]|uniref:Glycosyltransferase 61 catalytic domain-containing protein n=1 Tax=Paralvinella palmiformis TaxID=53620 RepID=A0AAD9N1Z1_9ANNE|nr:hypothetical protein LSH36_287g03033 [Paralvinella palmiformis]
MRVPFPFVGKRSFLALIAVFIFLFVALLLPALEQKTGIIRDVYHNIIWDIRGLVNEDLSPEVGRHLDRVDLRDETTSWNKRPRQRQNSSGIYDVPRDVIWVMGDEALFIRITSYNDVIYNVSERLLVSRRTNDIWQSPTLDKQIILVAGIYSDYLTKLASIPTVTTIVLAWSDRSGYSSGVGRWSSVLDKSNLLIQNYHPIVVSDSICQMIRDRRSFTRLRYDTVYNHECSSNVSDVFQVTSLKAYFINSLAMNSAYFWPNNGDAYPSHFYTDLPRLVTYIHVVQNAIVNELGDVITDRYKIVPYHCRPALNNKVTNYNTELLPLYTEVFSISQYWGGGFFHKTIEIFPKISPYLEFLKRKPHIKVQVYNKDDYTNFIMESLGIVRDRLISGVVRAHVIYLPRGTSCGTSNIQETQLLSHYLRLSVPKQEDGIRNLVLIRRSRSRSFTQQAKISEKLQVVAEEYGLKFYLFKDNPVPEMDEVRREFNKAAIVVAPHGAGLSNMLFCRPDTVVLEVICNPPHTNMCYTRLAHLLGLRYYALMSRGGCEAHINIPAEELEQLVRFLLKELKSRHEL